MTNAVIEQSAACVAHDVVTSARSRWSAGTVPDARGVLDGHPELRRHKSLALDLIYEEYCRRIDAGEADVSASIVRRYPEYRRSLERLLAVHDHFAHFSASPEWEPGLADWPQPGDCVQGFEIIEELGKGAFSRVYLAAQSEVGGRLVAVKVACYGRREAHLLGKLSHPNIVPIHSVAEDEAGVTVICMPFLGRATLCDVLDAAFADPQIPQSFATITAKLCDSPQNPAGPPSPSYVDAILQIGARLSDALAYTHARGILHGDIKPSNVLWADDAPMLLDFNLAVDDDDVRRLGGTLPYMAPERIEAVFLHSAAAARVPSSAIDEANRDPRTDVFSLGAVLYELLTGKLPFGAPETSRSPFLAAEEMVRWQQRGAEPIRALNPLVDKRAARLLNACLSATAAQRPSAEAMAAALRQALSPRRRGGRWMLRNRRQVMMMSVPVACGAVGGSWLLISRPPYPLRMYDSGVASCEAGEFEKALHSFERAIAEAPNSADIRFARGWARMAVGDYARAMDDFQRTNELARNPPPAVDALFGYCCSRLNQHDTAVASYLIALRNGYDTAEVHNNLGFSFLQGKGNLDRAMREFETAIQRNPTMQAAHHNRAVAGLRQRFRDEQFQLAAVVDDLELALYAGPVSAELHFHAALAYALRSGRGDQDKALYHLTQAVENGIPPDPIGKDAAFGRLHHDPRFRLLMERIPVHRRLPTRRLVEPATSARLHEL